MLDLNAILLELIRLASTDLPADVENALKTAYKNEENASAAQSILHAILENVALAKASSTPICQDTGTPIFRVRYPSSNSMRNLQDAIRSSTAEATRQFLLRPNAVHGLTGINSGNNLGGKYFPFIHFEEVEGSALTIDMILKGGGCENVGRQYSLPNAELGASRDLEGVRKCALDAVFHAQGLGCAPGFLGIAIGGDRGTSYLASKEAFFDPIGGHHPSSEIADLEENITHEANQLGIGPMGLGGNTTILGTRIIGAHRLPASFFVSVSYMCWAFRRARVTINGDKVEFNQYG